MSTTFTYKGKLDGHDVEGQVKDGQITGNPFVAIQVQQLVKNGMNIGLGPWSGPATLDDEILARATVAAVIEDPSFDPAPPDTGDIPEGAVS
jgi:hypothetical protein